MRNAFIALFLLAALLSGLGAKDTPKDEDASPFIGVNMRAMEAHEASTYGLKDAKGLVITQVLDGGPAAVSGLQVNDAVIAVAGSPLTAGTASQTAFKQAVGTTGVGKSLVLKVVSPTAPDGVANAPRTLTLIPISKGTWKTTFAKNLAFRITQDVQVLRELPAKREVHIDLMSRKGLYEKMLFEFNRDMISADTAKGERVLTLFGTLPGGVDTTELFLRMLQQGVQGFYTPDEKALFLIEGQGGGEYESTMAHEITHGLQDQHFNLNFLPMKNHDNSDLATVIRCVVEGDAKLLELEYIKKHQGGNQDGQWLKPQQAGGNFIPPHLSPEQRYMMSVMKEMMFPYMTGAQFVKAVHTRGGWDAVNRLYDDWPLSSEQILHHEKFFGPGFDDPVEIDAHDLIDKLDETSVVYLSDVIGELGIARYCLNFLDRQHVDAESFAAGWDGDRVVGGLMKKSGKPYYVWMSTWDTESDAIEFSKGMGAILQSRYTPGFQKASIKDLAPTTSQTVDAGTDGLALLTREGKSVIVVQAESQELVDELMDRASTSCKVRESAERPLFSKPAAGSGAQSPQAPPSKP